MTVGVSEHPDPRVDSARVSATSVPRASEYPKLERSQGVLTLTGQSCRRGAPDHWDGELPPTPTPPPPAAPRRRWALEPRERAQGGCGASGARRGSPLLQARYCLAVLCPAGPGRQRVGPGQSAPCRPRGVGERLPAWAVWSRAAHALVLEEGIIILPGEMRKIRTTD